MSKSSPEYLTVLEQTLTILHPPEGLSEYRVSPRSGQVQIVQNNTIIELLIQVIKKQNDISEQLLDIEKRIAHLENKPSQKERGLDLTQIIDKIDNLKLGTSSLALKKDKNHYTTFY